MLTNFSKKNFSGKKYFFLNFNKKQVITMFI